MGSHRRQRSSPRPGRGAAWVGLFLLLAVVAVLASRGLWSGFVADLLNLGPQSAPQGTLVWQATCAPGSTCAVGQGNRVLVVSPAAADGQSATAVAEAAGGTVTGIMSLESTVLDAAYYDPALTEPVGGGTYGAGDWRILTVREAAAQPGGSGVSGDSGSAETAGPPFITEEVLRLEPASAAKPVYLSTDAIVTSACGWVDEALAVIGLFDPGLKGDPRGMVVAVGGGGEVLWSRTVGRDPVHRVVARPGTGLIAAASPNTLALLDSHGNLLWSKTMRTEITDLALGSRGGPVAVCGKTLVVYDRRGNLVWRKQASGPLRAVACAADRIAVATPDGAAVYDEDGLERWSFPSSAPTDLDLDPSGDVLALVLETGTLVLARAPGGTAMPGPAMGSVAGSMTRSVTGSVACP